MNWRNGILIVCFVTFTPYAWEYLVAFFSGIIPAAAISNGLFGGDADSINARGVVEGIIYSLFACLVVAAPLGVIVTHAHLRTAIFYAGLSTVHLMVVFLYEHTSASTFYWPLVVAETITFFLWLCVAVMAGGAMRKTWGQFTG